MQAEGAHHREEAARHREEAARERREFREQTARALKKAERDRQAIREGGQRGRRAMLREINRCRGDVANKLGTVAARVDPRRAPAMFSLTLLAGAW